MLMAHLKADRKKQLILAGDPLQTINPTGFDWDTLKALMWRTLVDCRSMTVQPHNKLQEREANC